MFVLKYVIPMRPAPPETFECVAAAIESMHTHQNHHVTDPSKIRPTNAPMEDPTIVPVFALAFSLLGSGANPPVGLGGAVTVYVTIVPGPFGSVTDDALDVAIVESLNLVSGGGDVAVKVDEALVGGGDVGGIVPQDVIVVVGKELVKVTLLVMTADDTLVMTVPVGR